MPEMLPWTIVVYCLVLQPVGIMDNAWDVTRSYSRLYGLENEDKS